MKGMKAVMGLGLGLALFSTVASASPITLICTGSLTFAKQGSQKIESETAIVDFDAGSFKPPLYPALPITRVDESSVSFGNERADVSTQGGLDRISGSLWMNVMSTADRKKLGVGKGAQFMAWMSGKCAPAKRMF
ncbi:hypothetical protein ASC80_06385 [Afipia sp. Root123D2]|uniref:hypothetical protein n=1 Tax=Afipia sp. Root123D2 TaxID=1736436 RepID=UPI0006F2CFC4|nr:hypothetical protein [Afipia sp. Root123D2]KQW22951.1 hypothetical protein ASC80_06385 [Afipia sp. Root123D2]